MANEKLQLPDGKYIDIPAGTSDETKQDFLNKLFNENPNLVNVNPNQATPDKTGKVIPEDTTISPDPVPSKPVAMGKENSLIYELGVVAPYEASRKLINSTGNLIDGLGDTLGEATNFYGLALGKDAKNGLVELISYDEAKERKIKDPLWGEAGKIDFNNIQGFFYDPANPENDRHTNTFVGSIAETMMQFLIPYGGISKAVTLNPTTWYGRYALNASKGSAAGFVAFDENSGRATDLLASYAPNFVDNYLSYLKSDPNDKWWEGRLKNEIEGLGLGVIAEFIFKGAKLTKLGANKIANNIDAQADKKIIEEAQQKIAELKNQLEAGGTPKSTSDAMLEAHVVLNQIDGLPKIKKPEISIEQKVQLEKDLIKEEVNLNVEKWKNGDLSTEDAFLIPRRYFNFNTLPKIKYDEAGNAVRDAQGKVVVDVTVAQDRNDFVRSALSVFDVLKDNFSKWSPKFTDDVIRKSASEEIGDINKVVKDFGELTKATKDSASTVYAHEMILASMIKHLPSLQRDSILTKNTAQVDNVLAYIFTMWDNRGIFASNTGGNLRTLGMAKRDLQTVTTIEENLKKAINELNNFGGRDVSPEIRKQAFDKFKDKLSTLDSPSATRRILNWVFANKSWEVANQLWINSLLSNPKTLIVNGVGSAVASMAKPLSQKLGAKLSKLEAQVFDPENIGKIKEYEKQISEASETLASLAQFIGDSLTYAKSAWKNSEAVLEGATASTKTDTSFQAIPKELGGNIINAPSRALNATDEFFKQINYRAKVRGLAVAEAKAQNLTGKEFDDFIASYWRNSFDETGLRGTNLEALRYAKEVTFTNDLQGFAKGFQDFVNQYPILKQGFPFIRTPFNLAKAVADGTPLAGMYRWKDLLGQSGDPRAITRARGDLAMGSIFLTSAYLLYEAGIIQGATQQSGGIFNSNEGKSLDKFKDTDLVRMNKGTGFVPYSFKIGNTQIEFKRIEPFGTFFALIADIGENYNKLEEKQKEKLGASMLLWSMNQLKENPIDMGDRMKMGSLAVASGVRDNIFSKTFFTQANDILESIMNSDENSAGQYIRNKFGSFIPNIYTRALNDPFFRDSKNLIDEFKKRSGIGTPPSPYYNFMGEPLQNPTADVSRFANSVFSPMTIQGKNKDKVVEELLRIGEAPKKYSYYTDFGNDLRDFKSGANTAYDKLNDILRTTKINGLTLRQKLESEIGTDYYRQLSDPINLGKNVTDKGAKWNDVINYYTTLYKDDAERKFEDQQKFFKDANGKSLADQEKTRKNNLEVISNKRRTPEYLGERIQPDVGEIRQPKAKNKLDDLFNLFNNQQ
jgi:hypothetical protein